MTLDINLQCYDAMARIREFIDEQCLEAKLDIIADFADLRATQNARWDQIEVDILGTKEERAQRFIDIARNAGAFAA